MAPQGRAGSAALGRPLGAKLRDLASQLFGMPDYQRYLAHHDRCHHGTPAMSEREFCLAELRRKYEGGAGRCC